jgi:hypothetical protein
MANRREWEAGVELLAAQRLIPRGQWEKSCDENITLSRSYIKKVMKLAASSDPFAAHDEEANRKQIGARKKKETA